MDAGPPVRQPPVPAIPAGCASRGAFATVLARFFAARLPVAVLAALALAGLVATPTRAAASEEGRWIATATVRSLGYRDLREPASFTPSSAFVPQHGGWTRNWSERRAYATLAYRLVDTDGLVLAPGFHVGTSVGRFEAKNVGLGYDEAWETRPALLWGPSCDLVWRFRPDSGLFALVRYELFLAAAPEAGETVSSTSGTTTPPSARDASFSWTSHEVTAALGYDWGKVAVRAGLSFVAFRLDKRLTHHIDPAGATGNALAALVALDTQASRYGYEPASLVSPYLAMTFRPVTGCALEAALRPASQPDFSLSLSLSF
ncbi:MAG: hypothetical protein ACP59X_10690 [Solidesulfovibrio sp. DCME]|uniref:hypothetical protein n=1 Tax=Solidesulfovibrio sp. DCME TaxID=3447380 RepID=UPI003D0E5643